MVGRCLVRGSYKKWTLLWWSSCFFCREKAFQVLVTLCRNKTEEAENDDFFPPGIFFNHRRPWYFRVPKSFGVRGVKSGSYVEASPTWEDFKDLEDFLHQKTLAPNGKNLHHLCREIPKRISRQEQVDWSLSCFGCKMCRFLCLEFVVKFAPDFFLLPAYCVTGTTDCCLGGWVFKFRCV